MSLSLILLYGVLFYTCKSSEKVVRDFTQTELDAANTAANESYLSHIEKEIFYYLNLARMNPKVFARVHLKDYEGAPGYNKGYAFDERKISLLRQLESMQPLPSIMPNQKLFDMVECFAVEQGKKGIIGHDRSGTGCSIGYHAECCSYGNYTTGLYYVLELLIDTGEGNAALGHRKILLGNFLYMGVAHRDHAKYGKDVVLDFWRGQGGK